MQIMFIASTFKGWGSGSGYWFHKVAEILSKNEHVEIFSWNTCKDKPNNVKKLKWHVFEFLRTFRKYKHQPRIIHIPQHSFSFLSPLYKFITKCPVVLGPNTLPLDVQGGDAEPSKREKLITKFKFDAMIALSEAHKKVLERYGVVKDRIHIIKPGIELDIFKPQTVDKSKYGIGQDDFVFSFINRFHEVKQFHLFQKAMMDLLAKYKNVKFLIIGKEIPIKHPNVINLGFVERKQLPQYYNLSDVFVNTSKWETYSIASMEALACGKPCIMTNVGGTPEQIISGYNGFLVEPNCSNLTLVMEKIVNDRQLVIRMSHNARRFAEQNFNWDEKIKPLLELYKKLTGSL